MVVMVVFVEEGKFVNVLWGVNLLVDCLILECEGVEYDFVVLFGGMFGVERFWDL